MKMVIELPESTTLEPGTVWHTFGYPEPEIFGFLYVHPDRLVSVGIFVPSWMGDPSRTAYRYLQHYIQHPALWAYLKDGNLRSWGAKSLEESGKHGEPFLSGDGFARIGEGSGSTNMLTGSGVDEAWATGTQLAEAVVELLRAGKPFTKENLASTYEARRRASWVERGADEAKNSRNGFHGGIVKGMIGLALAGLTGGRLSVGARIPPAYRQIRHSGSGLMLKDTAELALADGRPLHDALLTARGWPEIPFDGRLLITQQDALLLGGKVQAMPGFADHVTFRDAGLCIACLEKTCIAMCSGQALTRGENGVPAFEREKCVHCGACLWNCRLSTDGEHSNIDFRAGAGGLHSAEN
jgi:electron-transferring-flavoprotein dehydrogenase